MDMVLSILLSTPVWLLLAVGVVYGLMTRHAHSRVSLLASVALAGFLALDFTGTLISQLYFGFVLPAGGGDAQAIAVRAFFVVQSIVHAILLALAITAAMLDRQPDEIPGQP